MRKVVVICGGENNFAHAHETAMQCDLCKLHSVQWAIVSTGLRWPMHSSRQGGEGAIYKYNILNMLCNLQSAHSAMCSFAQCNWQGVPKCNLQIQPPQHTLQNAICTQCNVQWFVQLCTVQLERSPKVQSANTTYSMLQKLDRCMHSGCWYKCISVDNNARSWQHFVCLKCV